VGAGLPVKPVRTWRRPRLAPVAVFLCVLALRLWAAGHAHPADDACITYRYAANLAHGHGFVFNPGERVLGTTTPLLTLLLAVPGMLGLDVATVGLGLCLVLSAVSAALLALLVHREAGHAVAAGAAATWLVFSTHQNYLATSGMETTLLIALMLGSFLLLRCERPLPATVLAAFTPLVRPEGLVWLVLCCAVLAVRHRRQWWLLGPALFPLALWGLFATTCFGSVIPQSVLAKRLQGGGPMSPGAEWLALLSPLGAPSLLVALVAGGLLYAAWRDRLLLLPVGFSIIFVGAYLWAGPTPYPWYPGPLDAALGIIAGVLVGRSLASLRASERMGLRHVAPLLVLVLLGLLLYGRADGMHRQLTQLRGPEVHRLLAEWVQEHTTATDVILVGDVGYIGYYNLDRRIYDQYGLVWAFPLPSGPAAIPDRWLQAAASAVRPSVIIASAADHRLAPWPGYHWVDSVEGYAIGRRM